MFKDFREPDNSIETPSIAHASYAPALAECFRRHIVKMSMEGRISKRIKDSIDVLRLVRDLFLKDKTEKTINLRKKATTIIAKRGVDERTIFAHLVGKNIPSKLSVNEFDILLKNWLIDHSSKLKEWYLQDANPSEIAYVNNFFDRPEVLDIQHASDITAPSETTRIETTTYRILRDTALSMEVKISHQFKCQLCGNRIKLSNGKYYAEAHHVKPLGRPHNGPDTIDNIICVCPTCHVLLDYKSIRLKKSQVPDIALEFIEYHNDISSVEI